MPANDGRKLTILGKLLILMLVVASFYGIYFHVLKGKNPLAKLSHADGNSVTIGIAYGTEKERWLKWTVEAFAKTPEGRDIQVQLIPMGSLEAAHAIIGGDQRITVWAPASSLYKDIFLHEWSMKNSGDPIAKMDNLALTPMVFVCWNERYQAFLGHYQTLSFGTLARGMEEKGGWNAIARQPDWGLFKFGLTDPSQSNSGLMTLVLMAYEYQNATRGLTMSTILDSGFSGRLQTFASGADGQQNSTGNLMHDMVLRGPSSYDVACVYECTTIDYLKNAEGRWGDLHVVYPAKNMWNENPYYILNVPWSTPAQRVAAEAFLQFLLSEPVQREALTHGFRPGNVNVPIRFAGSPFVEYGKNGLKIDIGTTCEAPKSEVLNTLLESWQRGSR